MSAQSGPDVTALLEVHVAHCVGGVVTWWAECLDVDCTWEKSGDVGGFPAGLAAHRAHLAQAIRAEYANWIESEAVRGVAHRAFVAAPPGSGKYAVLTALADLLRWQA